jgi:hypothetical protein
MSGGKRSVGFCEIAGTAKNALRASRHSVTARSRSVGTVSAHIYKDIPHPFRFGSQVLMSIYQALNSLLILGWKQAGLDTIAQKP